MFDLGLKNKVVLITGGSDGLVMPLQNYYPQKR